MATGSTWAAEVPTILCFGDSLTAGFGVASRESYPSLLQERLRAKGYDYKVVNAGVSGDTTAGGLSRLAWSLRSKPVLAVVSLGANDGFRGLDPQQMEQNLRAIIHKLQQAKVQVVLAGMRLPPNYGRETVRRFEEVFPRLAEQEKLPFVPFLLAGVAGDAGLNLDDGIHPNGLGYRVVLDNVWQVLEPLLPPR